MHPPESSDTGSCNLGGHASAPHCALLADFNRRIGFVNSDSLGTRLVRGLVEYGVDVSEKGEPISIGTRGKQRREPVIVGENTRPHRRPPGHNVVLINDGDGLELHQPLKCTRQVRIPLPGEQVALCDKNLCTSRPHALKHESVRAHQDLLSRRGARLPVGDVGSVLDKLLGEPELEPAQPNSAGGHEEHLPALFLKVLQLLNECSEA
mmetsp:Transcript_28697/g.67144  ORF Transcript_28697/g.67144 Transcript_28697/m.67144 type:complete len:208 (-) Transcript_28697:192-815(-)